MRAAARRLGLMFVSAAGSTAVLGVIVGLLFGSSVGRGLSVAWYIAGSALLLGGFFIGNRGPARPQGEGWSAFSMRRWVRWATPEEQRESISLSALLIVLGLLLIVLGVLVDPHQKVI